jgi:1-deoxy-D-xylulose-5-phosphate reductoisomerase
MVFPLKIHILGVTGSIGQNTADIILSMPERFDVGIISAHSNKDKLEEMAGVLSADQAILTQDGDEALCEALRNNPADICVAGIMGMAGLRPLLAAIPSVKTMAIANKEPLVAAWPFVHDVCQKYVTQIVPLDSEHNAIFQVFDQSARGQISRIIITASGGPFLRTPIPEMKVATREQALAHPNWSMGDKISIDSATMMNKALEVIEAHVLFDMSPEMIDVIIHPQSIVHSMVEYIDGSILAQMGPNDMRTPIAAVLAYPERLPTSGPKIDIQQLSSLEFEDVDPERFPAVGLAYEALSKGLHARIALNAANEVAVQAFLDDKIGFGDIVPLNDHMMKTAEHGSLHSVEDVLDYDAQMRQETLRFIQQNHTLPVREAQR